MKIGTLTLHLPFNYGNALQQFSLHQYLIEQGYDAEVISHWFLENKDEILYYHNRLEQVRFYRFRFMAHCLTFNGVFAQYLRERKIKKWLDEKIKWSKAQGTDATLPIEKIADDTIIVGSDQVWNPVYETSNYFLLGEFPNKIKKISYATSFGGKLFPEEKKDFYKKCLKDFYAISVRESSAVEILREFGIPATLVCDPTLLHSKEEWCRLLGVHIPSRPENELVMYLVTPDHRAMWQEAIRLARESHKKVHVFVFSWTGLTISSIRPFKSGLRRIVSNICLRMRLFFAGVRLHFSADPSEFVQRIAASDGVVTDSFHGMIFATIFEKKCNVIIGEHPERQQMAARLVDFTKDFGDPASITSRVDVHALRPLKVTPKLNELIVLSKQWLREVLTHK